VGPSLESRVVIDARGVAQARNVSAVWAGSSARTATPITTLGMSDVGEPYEVVGAAMIPLPGILGVSVSYPLAALEVTAGGVCVRLTWGQLSALLSWLMVRMGAPEGCPAEWRASWGSIDRVLVGPRSLVLFRGTGYPCRFATWKRSEITQVVDDLVTHQVAVESSRTTLRYAYYASQPSSTNSVPKANRSYLRLVAFAPILVGVGGIVLLTQAGRWSWWSLAGFVIAGLGAAASMVGLVGQARGGK
jgi:hypothetical protein